jgi:hypothetical protein
MRALNHVVPDLLEGVASTYVAINMTEYRPFHRNTFGYLCAVMKNPSAAIDLSDFQRNPLFMERVSRDSDAWRPLINIFDQKGVGGKTYGEEVDAYLQRMLDYSQDISEDNHTFHESLLAVFSLFILHPNLIGRGQVLLLPWTAYIMDKQLLQRHSYI